MMKPVAVAEMILPIHYREFETNNDGWTLVLGVGARVRDTGVKPSMNALVKVSLDRTAYAGKWRDFSKSM